MDAIPARGSPAGLRLKRTLVRPLHVLGLRTGVSVLAARARSVARVLMFHGVGSSAFPAAEFDRQIAWVCERFDVVPLDRIVRAITAGEPPPRHAIALTFDDGLRCHRRVVAPVLERHGAPATFYVCPGLIDSGAWIWNMDARARLCAVDPDTRREWARAAGAPSGEPDEAVEWMKGLALHARRAAHDRLREVASAFVPTPEQREANDPLTWEDIAALDPALITIGSHTLDHPLLTTIDGSEIERQVRGARRRLEERTGRLIAHFCYPNGAWDERALAVVRRTHASAVTVESGFVARGADPHRLSRIPAAEDSALLAWRMHRPGA